ncbi:MAG TPA: hypothetical protein DD791_12875 [Syntrophomonas sp.]|nr:hypothetical protein [Syntrophomonas sp.]
MLQPRTRSQFPAVNRSENLLEKIQQELDVICTIEGRVVILLSSNLFGQGDNKAGNILMEEFTRTLSHMTGIINTLILINSAVFLATEGSEMMPFFKIMEEQGVEILCSESCLSFYSVQERLSVGSKASMYTISSRLLQAGWVISL